MKDDDRHACPYESCSMRIGRELFACSTHWFQLSRDTRNAIYSAYRRFGIGSSELAAAHERAYREWGQA